MAGQNLLPAGDYRSTYAADTTIFPTMESSTPPVAGVSQASADVWPTGVTAISEGALVLKFPSRRSLSQAVSGWDLLG